MNWIVALAAGLSLLALIMALKPILLPGHKKRQEDFDRRLNSLKPHHVEPREAARVLLRDNSLSTIPLLDSLLKILPLKSNINKLLAQAGHPCNLGTFILLTATLAGMGGLLGHFSRLPWFWLIIGGAAAMIPRSWVKVMRRRRLNAFSEQFPEAVDLIARSLRAGHS